MDERERRAFVLGLLSISAKSQPPLSGRYPTPLATLCSRRVQSSLFLTPVHLAAITLSRLTGNDLASSVCGTIKRVSTFMLVSESLSSSSVFLIVKQQIFRDSVDEAASIDLLTGFLSFVLCDHRIRSEEDGIELLRLNFHVLKFDLRLCSE